MRSSVLGGSAMVIFCTLLGASCYAQTGTLGGAFQTTGTLFSQPTGEASENPFPADFSSQQPAENADEAAPKGQSEAQLRQKLDRLDRAKKNLNKLQHKKLRVFQKRKQNARRAGLPKHQFRNFFRKINLLARKEKQTFRRRMNTINHARNRITRLLGGTEVSNAARTAQDTLEPKKKNPAEGKFKTTQKKPKKKAQKAISLKSSTSGVLCYGLIGPLTVDPKDKTMGSSPPRTVFRAGLIDKPVSKGAAELLRDALLVRLNRMKKLGVVGRHGMREDFSGRYKLKTKNHYAPNSEYAILQRIIWNLGRGVRHPLYQGDPNNEMRKPWSPLSKREMMLGWRLWRQEPPWGSLSSHFFEISQRLKRRIVNPVLPIVGGKSKIKPDHIPLNSVLKNFRKKHGIDLVSRHGDLPIKDKVRHYSLPIIIGIWACDVVSLTQNMNSGTRVASIEDASTAGHKLKKTPVYPQLTDKDFWGALKTVDKALDEIQRKKGFSLFK